MSTALAYLAVRPHVVDERPFELDPQPTWDPQSPLPVHPPIGIPVSWPLLPIGGPPAVTPSPGTDPVAPTTPVAPSAIPPQQPASTRPPTPVELVDAADHVAHGARSLVVPSLVAGALVGGLAASAAPALKGGVFAGRALGQVAGGIATGAAMGLLVGATAPEPGEDLRPRYALAGAAVGAASGALFGAPGGRPLAITIGAVGNAVLGWLIGGRAPGHAGG